MRSGRNGELSRARCAGPLRRAVSTANLTKKRGAQVRCAHCKVESARPCCGPMLHRSGVGFQWSAATVPRPGRGDVILSRAHRQCMTQRWLAERRADWEWEMAMREAMHTLACLAGVRA